MDETLLALGRQLLLFGALLTPLELLWPASDHGVLRRGVGTDLIWTVVNTALLAVLGGAMLGGMAHLLGGRLPVSMTSAIAAQPVALQVIELIVLSEVFGTLAHRASHHSPLLWRFHAIHHSTTEMGWLSAHRQHPIDAFWLLGATNLPLVVLGFDAGPLFVVILLQKLHTAWVHANTRLPEGRWERWLAGPRFHRWHHARGQDQRNYAALLPMIDRVMGTWVLPAGEPPATGVADPIPTGVIGQLLWPVRQDARRSPNTGSTA